MDEATWNSLLDTVAEVQQWFPEGVAFIGGIAVYAHLIDGQEHALLAAMSHDADFVILIPDFADLRDIEVVTPNRRLEKAQFVKNGFEFDVYVEHQNDLVIPVNEAIAGSQMRMDLRVVCLEHLLCLKAVALMDRRGTSKGDKDEDDIARILLALKEPDAGSLSRLDEDKLSAVEKAISGDAFFRLAKGNSHQARQLKEIAERAFDKIRQIATPMPTP